MHGGEFPLNIYHFLGALKKLLALYGPRLFKSTCHWPPVFGPDEANQRKLILYP